MQAEFQSAACKISGIENPASAATEIEAPHTECALNIAISMPALANPVLIHLAIVDAAAGWCLGTAV